MTFKERIYQEVNIDKEFDGYMEHFDYEYPIWLYMLVSNTSLERREEFVLLDAIPPKTEYRFYYHTFEIPKQMFVTGILKSGMPFCVEGSTLSTDDPNPEVVLFSVDEKVLDNIPEEHFEGLVRLIKVAMLERKQKYERAEERYKAYCLMGMKHFLEDMGA